MSLFLCVDCGGSKTSAVIADAAGNIVGRALGGPSNFAYLGIDAFVSAVRESVSKALQTCVSPPSETPVALPPATPLFAAAWLGVSGVDSQAAIAKLMPVVSQLLNVPEGPNLLVGNDTSLLAAPLQMHDDVSCAVTCISGTGGIVVSFIKTPEGRLQEMGRVGGWGWILGDEGGGYHVGREAVRQILMRADVASVEGAAPPPSVFEQRVLQRFGLSDVFELLTAIHLPDPTGALPADAPSYAGMPREKRLSSLAPLVFEAAFTDKDALALSVLDAASAELVAEICILLRDDARAKKGVTAAKGVICFGGSLVGVEAYRKMILGKLAEKGHVFRRVEFINDAGAVGAQGLAAAAHATKSS